MSNEIPVTRARAEFAELVNRVVYGAERIVMTRHGKPLVALVSAADLRRLEMLDAGTDFPDNDDLGAPAAVIHLAAEPLPAPAPPARPARERHLDIAADHRPPTSAR